ncbi:MAG: hypothetical protein H0W42_12500 [Gemmatimonadaceae bacterium]|nr:hypothetical protein [Gemmatimonadaceae bacterium]
MPNRQSRLHATTAPSSDIRPTWLSPPPMAVPERPPGRPWRAEVRSWPGDWADRWERLAVAIEAAGEPDADLAEAMAFLVCRAARLTPPDGGPAVAPDFAGLGPVPGWLDQAVPAGVPGLMEPRPAGPAGPPPRSRGAASTGPTLF